jgi:T5orf172 domain
MAARSIASGELYFVGEKDPLTNEDTQFVKIGIVRENENRTTDYRIKEHQTGNPRLLHSVSIIETPIVERVETTMHGKFAPWRLSGEWFVFRLSERSAAIKAAEELASQASANQRNMKLAEEFKSVKSLGEMILPSNELLDVHRRLVGIRSQIKACKSMADSVVNALKDASTRGVDVTKLLTFQDKKGAERFDAENFKLKHPNLWTQFVTVEPSFKGSFLVTDPAAARPDPFALFPELSELNRRIEQALLVGNYEVSELHEMFLEVLTLQSPAEWEEDLLEDQIKSECGNAPGLSGVCKWSREEVSKEVFDKAGLKAAHPDTYTQFVTVGESTRSAVPARDRGFQI